MKQMAPADELALIRARIAQLRTREKILSDALLNAPEAARLGESTRIMVKSTVLRIFDHRLLSDEIRAEPHYWREREKTDLCCIPLAGQGPSRRGRQLPAAPRADQRPRAAR